MINITPVILLSVNILLLITIIVIIKRNGGGKIEKLQESLDKQIQDEFSRNRDNFNHSQKDLRTEIQAGITNFSQSIVKNMMEISKLQNTQFEKIRQAVENQLKLIRDDNSKQLEKMRQTVDEKLHATLEKRLNHAFQQVSDRLEKVHMGLGEMQKLASGVGDLKKVLSNVKARGTLGEIQLKNQLSQLLSPQQYQENVKTKKDSGDFVEFAIRLPGKENIEEAVWLPVDSKFPLEQYDLLLTAYDSGTKEEITAISKKLASDIKNFAKQIRDKYLDPPHTTDFALMYLPVEGLYAEVLRFSGLFETLQREFRVVPVGPTTLAAILNSLQLGFRTLAIEKRSSEVWTLLGAVKTQFGKFGDLLDKTRKKLSEASQSIEDASKKSRFIEGRLGKVQELPEKDSGKLLSE